MSHNLAIVVSNQLKVREYPQRTPHVSQILPIKTSSHQFRVRRTRLLERLIKTKHVNTYLVQVTQLKLTLDHHIA